MAKRIAPDELHQLARMGAMVRLRQLEAEAAAIRRMFPGLKADSSTPAPEAPPQPRVARKRRGMSAAAREAARERMKAYWAKKKGEQAAGPEGGQTQAADRPPKKRSRRASKGRRAAGRRPARKNA